MDTEIRVSTESRPWRRKFSRRSYRDLNPGPFSHESGALTTELSPSPLGLQLPWDKILTRLGWVKPVTATDRMLTCLAALRVDHEIYTDSKPSPAFLLFYFLLIFNLLCIVALLGRGGWVGVVCTFWYECPLVVFSCCEHTKFCVEVFYALYINFHSFIHPTVYNPSQLLVYKVHRHKIKHWNVLNWCIKSL